MATILGALLILASGSSGGRHSFGMAELLFGVIIAPVVVVLLMLPWYIAFGLTWIVGATDPVWIVVLVVPSAFLEYGAICGIGMLIGGRRAAAGGAG